MNPLATRTRPSAAKWRRGIRLGRIDSRSLSSFRPRDRKPLPVFRDNSGRSTCRNHRPIQQQSRGVRGSPGGEVAGRTPRSGRRDHTIRNWRDRYWCPWLPAGDEHPAVREQSRGMVMARRSEAAGLCPRAAHRVVYLRFGVRQKADKGFDVSATRDEHLTVWQQRRCLFDIPANDRCPVKLHSSGRWIVKLCKSLTADDQDFHLCSEESSVCEERALPWLPVAQSSRCRWRDHRVQRSPG